MSHHFLSFVSDFGDTAVTLPLAAILALYLWRAQSAAPSASALRSLALCLWAIALLKMTFIACRPHWANGLVSPSGHAAVSLTVYGMAATVLAASASGWWRLSLIAVAAALITAIAISRVLLDVHTAAEVLVGLLVGGAALGVFAARYCRTEPPDLGRRRAILLALVLIVPLAVLHGERLPAERWVRQTAVKLRTDFGLCRAPHHRAEVVEQPQSAGPSA